MASLAPSGFIAAVEVLILSCSYIPCAVCSEFNETDRSLVKLEVPGLGERRGAKTLCEPEARTALSRSMCG
jgi:hypothetical protein